MEPLDHVLLKGKIKEEENNFYVIYNFYLDEKKILTGKSTPIFYIN